MMNFRTVTIFPEAAHRNVTGDQAAQFLPEKPRLLVALPPPNSEKKAGWNH